MTAITFYSLYDYNCGNLFSNTFDLDNFSTLEELDAALHDWLEELTENRNDGVTREEWILADCEDVPDQYINTYGINGEYFTYRDTIDELSNYHDDAENILNAWIAYGYELNLDEIKDAYIGHFYSIRSFAEEYLWEIMDLSSLPQHLQFYIDLERLAKDVLINDCWESNGYYFNRI